MGTFIGHLLNGLLLLTVSFWWAADALNHYYKKAIQRKCNSSSSDDKFDFSHCHNKLRQGLFVVSATIIGMVAEYLTAFEKKPICTENLQHMSIHLFFFFFGLSYLLSYWSAPLPVDVPYFTLLLAFFGETLLLYFHLHGRSHIDIHVHTLLIIATAFTGLSICFEWKYKESVMAALGRPFWCFVQGTWLCQIAFILFNPLPNARKWDNHNHNQLMVITSMFCWHIIAALIWFTFLCFQYNRKYNTIWDLTETRKMVNVNYQQLKIDDDN